MKELRAGSPFTIGEISIVPLEKVHIHHNSNEGRFSIYVSKEPIGIVISSPQGKWALDIYGDQISVETYIQEIDGLQQLLDNL